MPGFLKYYEFEPKSTPIPGDIDNDGYKEIVFVTGEYVLCLPNIHVLRIDGIEQAGWPVYYYGKQYDDFKLVDVDGGNSVDILLSSFYAYDKYGTLISGKLFNLSASICPNFSDLNNDGLLDLAMLTQREDYYAYLFNINVPYHPEKTLWGKLFHDNYNTNNTEFEVKRKKGDLNNGSIVDIVDVIFLLNFLFKNGKKPTYLDQADVNCDSHVDISDLIYLYNYLFRNEKPLCPS